MRVRVPWSPPLPYRLMVGRAAVNRRIGVRILVGEPAVLGQRSDRRVANADAESSNLSNCTSTILLVVRKRAFQACNESSILSWCTSLASSTGRAPAS